MQYLYKRIYEAYEKNEKKIRAAILYNVVNTKYRPISNIKITQLWDIHNKTFKS